MYNSRGRGGDGGGSGRRVPLTYVVERLSGHKVDGRPCGCCMWLCREDVRRLADLLARIMAVSALSGQFWPANWEMLFGVDDFIASHWQTVRPHAPDITSGT